MPSPSPEYQNATEPIGTKQPDSQDPKELWKATDTTRDVEASSSITATSRHAGQTHKQNREVPDQSTRYVEGGPGFFAGASHFTLRNPVMSINYNNGGDAMESLEKHTIRGAEFDSSDRSPPPRCHPGTRKTIVERTQQWFANTERRTRILWLVGSAGVGKSAIMQTLAEYVAESPNFTLGATLFFSRPNRRRNPLKVFITLAYQIAIISPAYRQFVLREITTNPRLPTKSMEAQFARLFVEPFVHLGIHRGSSDLLIFLDGLDECEGHPEQCEIIELISSFSLAHPNTPLLWIISSRPESHLKATFSREAILPSYEKEEVPIDSDEACADVEKYLRREFGRIQRDDPIARLYPEWPTETAFLTITAAAGGLFAFASTAIKFVGDPIYKNPVAALVLLLAAVNKVSPRKSKGWRHPLAYLDALYTCILSEIPEGSRFDTYLLLANHLVLQKHSSQTLRQRSLAFLCNWISMSPNDAYSALDRLHSVLTVPPPEDAGVEGLAFHHQSFYEYLTDPKRSQAFHISPPDMDEQELERALRILKDVHLGMTAAENMIFPVCKVALSWEAATRSAVMQGDLYDCAAYSIIGIVDRYDPDLVLPIFQDRDVIKVIKTLSYLYPRNISTGDYLLATQFLRGIHYSCDPRIRTHFETLGILRVIPIKMLDLNHIRHRAAIFAYYTRGIDRDGMLDSTPQTLDNPLTVDYGPNGSKLNTTDFYSYEDKQSVFRNLRRSMTETPDVPVLCFGNVIGTYLICHYKLLDESHHWTYYIRYHPLEGHSTGDSEII